MASWLTCEFIPAFTGLGDNAPAQRRSIAMRAASRDSRPSATLMPTRPDLARRNTCRALLVLCALTAGSAVSRVRAAETESFAALVARLSEPAGDFGGDNLITNEQSYLRVMPGLARAEVRGGAYVGVGPEQNFAYIAQIKPEIAYIIDIRRDNLLLHLLLKALFVEAPTRVEFLAMLTGRAAPADHAKWHDAPIEKIIAHIDATPPRPEPEQQKIRERLEAAMRGFGIPLSAADLATLAKARQQFVVAGLSLVFQARNQPLRSYYPNLRTLLREDDGAGRQLSFLANEPAFQFVRSLQARNRIVPVVGDVSGPHAMRAIAADMQARGLRLSGYYISNVEDYLFRGRQFTAYAENVRQFPHDSHSMVIRSIFPSGGGRQLPQAVPGHYSTSILQPFEAMLADLATGKYRTYRDLVAATPP